MKKLVIIFSSILFLCSATELHELMRLPALVAHYNEHRSKDDNLSFIDFLKIHYTGNHPKDNDNSEDDKLPFNSGDAIQHVDIPVLEFAQFDNEPGYIVMQKSVFSNSEDIPENTSSGIFHPPKLS